MPVDLILLSGFLGSGKTTLLVDFLRQDAAGETGVIINEVGEIGVDGAIVADSNVPMLELANGCVCCSLRSGLVHTVGALLDAPRQDGPVAAAPGHPGNQRPVSSRPHHRLPGRSGTGCSRLAGECRYHFRLRSRRFPRHAVRRGRGSAGGGTAHRVHQAGPGVGRFDPATPGGGRRYQSAGTDGGRPRASWRGGTSLRSDAVAGRAEPPPWRSVRAVRGIAASTHSRNERPGPSGARVAGPGGVAGRSGRAMRRPAPAVQGHRACDGLRRTRS